MDIPKEALDNLRAAHRKETGQELTESKALSIARELFRVYESLFLPPGTSSLDSAN